jgi:hypothetical protein
MVYYWTMKILSVSNAKSQLGRVIDRVIKTREPVVIPRGERHVMIAPYDLPTPDVVELARIGRELDDAGKEPPEDEQTLKVIQAEIRAYRTEKRRK